MIVYLILTIVGALLLAGAVIDLKGRLKFVKTGERSMGTVVQVVEKNDDVDGTFYYPVYEISTRQNETITYRHNTASSPSRWRVGQQAAFIFEPGKPETTRLLSYWAIFWWPLSLMAVAINLIIIGGGYFLLQGYYGG